MFVVFAPVTGISFFSDFKSFVVSFRPTPPRSTPALVLPTAMLPTQTLVLRPRLDKNPHHRPPSIIAHTTQKPMSPSLMSPWSSVSTQTPVRMCGSGPLC